MIIIRLFWAGVFSVLVFPLFAQIEDQFNDGELMQNPAWLGQTQNFIINEDTALQMNANAAGSSLLYTSIPSAYPNMEWHFRLKQNFAGSSNNYSRIYLNNIPSANEQLIYFLQFGEAGSEDAIRLYQSQNNIDTLLASGPIGMINSSFDLNVRMIRNDANEWILYAAQYPSNEYDPLCTYQETSPINLEYFCLNFTYTLSNTDNIVFDDFYIGPEIMDTVPPQLIGILVENNFEIHCQFSERLDTLQPPAVQIINHPATNSLFFSEDRKTMTISWEEPFPMNENLMLEINGAKDLTGNESATLSTSFTLWNFQPPASGDVIINEFLPDPSNILASPNAEFIEIFNASNKLIDLKKLSINDKIIGDSSPLFPGSYLVLTHVNNSLDFLTIDSVSPIDGFPQLSNSGKTLFLKFEDETIDELSYDLTWYNNQPSEGISLERINPFDPCSDPSNWGVSKHPSGATAGAENSIFDISSDIQNPRLYYVLSPYPDTLTLVFNEPLDPMSNQTIEAAISDASSTQNATALYVLSNRLQIVLSEPLNTGIHNLEVKNVADCWGNKTTFSKSFGIAGELPQKLLINEIMFDPKVGEYDYVELVNPGPHCANLRNWRLTEGDHPSNISGVICNEDWVLLPGELAVFSEFPQSLQKFQSFNPNRSWKVDDLATMNKSGGRLCLFNPQYELMQEVEFNEEMHFPMLQETTGVALEKMHISDIPFDPSHWHSASQNSGFGTPGSPNSQLVTLLNGHATVKVNPDLISPDNDGYDDACAIQLQFDDPGTILSATIFNLQGGKIKTLASSMLCGTKEILHWDGYMDTGISTPVGVYILYIEGFSTTGRSIKMKKTITIAHKL